MTLKLLGIIVNTRQLATANARLGARIRTEHAWSDLAQLSQRVCLARAERLRAKRREIT